MSDREWKLSELPAVAELWQQLVASLTFLTRLPLSTSREPMALASATPMFPVVGALIGAVTGFAAALLTSAGMSPFVAASLALAASLCLTGALHEDGLADTADGFGGGNTRMRKLEIMRDSRIGTYGTLALVVSSIGKVAGMGAIVAGLGWCSIIVLAAAGAASRTSMVWLLATTPAARSDGVSASAGQPDGPTLRLALGVGAVVTVLLLGWSIGLVDTFFALLTIVAVALAARRLSLRMVGGQTGDICGALQVTSEVAMLAVISASLH